MNPLAFEQQQAATANRAAQQLAKQQDRHAFQLQQQYRARTSMGFNLDALGTPDQVSSLAATYDQIQVRNGAQSILFQRDTGAAGSSPVTTQSVVKANGQLAAVPAFGPIASETLKQQSAFEAAAQKSVPAWERYAIPAALGAGALIVLVIVLRK